MSYNNLHTPKTPPIFSLKIPVSPQVLKFVLWLEHIPTDTPRPLIKRHSVTGIFLNAFLVEADIFNTAPELRKVEDYTAYLDIEVEADNQERGIVFLPDFRIIQFNNIMRASMLDYITKRLIDRDSTKTSMPTESIHDFMTDMELSEEDIGFEALKKATYRHLKGKAQRLPTKKTLRYAYRVKRKNEFKNCKHPPQ